MTREGIVVETTHTPGDPTSRTLQTVHREVETLGDKMETLFEGAQRLTNEQFVAVELQFTLVERLRVEQKADTKAAVDAALTAQKEAVKEQTTASDRAIAKSETAMTKQLEQLIVTFTTAISGVTDTIDGVKERVGKVEGIRQGGKDATAAMYALGGFVIAVVPAIGVLFAIR